MKIKNIVKKRNTTFREAITPIEKLSVRWSPRDQSLDWQNILAENSAAAGAMRKSVDDALLSVNERIHI